MKEKIILIGGGGHCKACIDVIETESKFCIAGIVDVKEKVGQEVLRYKIIACDDDIPTLLSEYKYFLITIGQVYSVDMRREKFNKIKKSRAGLPVIVSPRAYVSRHASIGEGTIVMHNACINASAVIGKNCIVNTGAFVEHDVLIGDHCHISTGSIVDGGCSVGGRVFIGSNAVLVNNITIGENVIVGAGAVITHSLNDSGTYVGNPARKVK